MRQRYGVPFQGSKNQIAKDIINVLPGGKRFVDLFAGGCAMTHAAVLSGKYETYLANDLHGMGVRLFMDAIEGKCKDLWKIWVSREEFYAKRDTVPWIALCWSFGNNQSQYVYGKEIEEKKHKAFDLLVSGTKSETQVESAERLQSVEGLQYVEALQSVAASFKSYDEIEIQDGDVVYCDIPYRSASEIGGGYRFLKRAGIGFDFDKFYDWCLTRDYPVFVSEYEMPEGDFVSLWEKEKIGLFKKTQNNEYHIHTEHLFVQAKYAELFKRSGEKGTSEQMEFDLAV